MKITIIGYSGSGKSTLARKLSEIYDISLLHLDMITHNPGWIKKASSEIEDALDQFLTNNSSWVIDGNYTKYYFEKRCVEANKIIILNFNRIFCFFSAFRRYLKYKNKCRESAPIGCNETFDYKFIKWLLIDGRTKKRRKLYKEVKGKYVGKVIVFKNRKQVNKYIKNLQ